MLRDIVFASAACFSRMSCMVTRLCVRSLKQGASCGVSHLFLPWAAKKRVRHASSMCWLFFHTALRDNNTVHLLSRPRLTRSGGHPPRGHLPALVPTPPSVLACMCELPAAHSVPAPPSWILLARHGRSVSERWESHCEPALPVARDTTRYTMGF